MIAKIKGFFMPSLSKVIITVLPFFAYIVLSDFCTPLLFRGGEASYPCGYFILFLFDFGSYFPWISIVLAYLFSCLIVSIYGNLVGKMGPEMKVRKDKFVNGIKRFFMPSWSKVTITALPFFAYFALYDYCNAFWRGVEVSVYRCGLFLTESLNFLEFFPKLSIVLAYLLSCLIVLIYRKVIGK